MSYPFQSGPSNHPYPPSLSYPSAPPPDQQQYPTNPPYPPTQGGYPPLNQAPYPQNPYPPQSTPYPTSQPPYPQSTPYPVNPPQYPPAPYPPSQGSYPYPTNQGGYPPAPTNPTPYPTSQTYPPQPAYPSHPPTGGPNIYPNLPRESGYHGVHSGHTSHPVSKINPTVRPANPFNPRQDAEVLRKAMKGLGTDEAAIIAVLSRRTNAQRQEIAKEFKTLYGKDLIKDLKSELSGKLEQLVLAMMTPIHEYYAHEVRHAISGIGTNESTLIEVLCTLNNSELYYIKTTYERLYNSSMESDLRSDTSGSFKRLLTSLCVGRRDESGAVDYATAEADAQALLSAGELRFGTDESTFNAILASRSFSQLQVIFNAYEKISGHPIEKAIKSEFSGDIENGLLAIVQCVRNKAAYIAHRLHESMAGAGTNDRALIRLIVTRSEIDLEDVKHQFAAKYGKSLESFIKNDTSGDYKKMLIALLG